MRAARLLALAMLTTCGCACTAPRPEPELAQALAASAPALEHVHVVLVDSPLDPLGLTGADRLAARLREAGVVHATIVGPGDGVGLAEILMSRRADDPSARLVLVGWSGGSLTVWDTARALETAGERVDAIVYLDSAWIRSRVRAQGHPANADRVLLVYRDAHRPPDVPGATIVRVPTPNHLAVATHPVVLETLATLSIEVAGGSGPTEAPP